MNCVPPTPGRYPSSRWTAATAAQLSNDAQVKQAEGKLAAATAPDRDQAGDRDRPPQRGDLEKAKADVHKAEVDLSYCTIKAPQRSGKVTRKSVEAGTYVQTGEQLLALVPSGCGSLPTSRKPSWTK